MGTKDTEILEMTSADGNDALINATDKELEKEVAALQSTEAVLINIGAEEEDVPLLSSSPLVGETLPVTTNPMGELPTLSLKVEDPVINEDTFDVVQSLKDVVEVQSSLNAMKDNLVKVVDALGSNPSIINRVAKSWGAMHWLSKMGTGVAVVAPTLIIGLAASIPGLVIFSGSSAIIYAGGGALLSEHNASIEDNKLRLREGVIGLHDLFDAAIMAIEKLRHKLAIDVDRLCSENIKLAENITKLHTEVESLTDQVETLSGEVTTMKSTNVQLAASVEALNATKLELDKKVEQADAVGIQLSTAITTLMTSQADKAVSDEAYQQKLDNVLDTNHQMVVRLAKRVTTAETELVAVQKELHASNQKYEALNERHEKAVARLERVLQHPAVQALELDTSSPVSKSAYSNAETMGQLGTFGCRDAVESSKLEQEDYRQPLVGKTF